MDTLTVWIDTLSALYPEEDITLMSEYTEQYSPEFSRFLVEGVLDKVRKDLRAKAGLKSCNCTCHDEKHET